MRNRYSPTVEASIRIEKNLVNLSEMGRSIPTFKFEKYTDRKLEVADVHEMRFETINRDSTAMSKNKRVQSLLSLEKSPERDFSHMINKNIFKNDYEVNES